MRELGIAVDGGKDSLSMAVKAKKAKTSVSSEVVKSPGTIVISAYAPVPDIRVKVTPELKAAESCLIHIDLSGRKKEKSRTGASALAQVFNQIGNIVPDIDDSSHLSKGFTLVQRFIREGKCTAGHDISDGGLITCFLEMAFASNMGLNIVMDSYDKNDSIIDFLFSEECGVIIQVPLSHADEVKNLLRENALRFQVIGHPVDEDKITVKVNGETVVEVRKYINSRDSHNILIPFYNIALSAGKDDSS